MANESKYQLSDDAQTDEARAKMIHTLRELENNIYMSYDFFHGDSIGSNNDEHYQYDILKKIHKLGLSEYNQFMNDFVHHYYGGKTTHTEHDWYSRDHNDIYGDIADNLVFQYSQYECEEMSTSLVVNYYVKEPLQKLIELTAKDNFFAELHQQYQVFEKDVQNSGF